MSRIKNDRWLAAICRDRRIPGNSFRMGYALAYYSVNGFIRTDLKRLQQHSGLASYVTARASLDRLAACGYVRYERSISHGPLDVTIIPLTPRQA